jgi:hypothetical protein
MKKRSPIVKILTIANALFITAAFVGCPARKNPDIATIAPPPPTPPLVTIAPYGGNFQHLLPSDQTPAPANQDSNKDKQNP